jgi:hypothetical protein
MSKFIGLRACLFASWQGFQNVCKFLKTREFSIS